MLRLLNDTHRQTKKGMIQSRLIEERLKHDFHSFYFFNVLPIIIILISYKLYCFKTNTKIITCKMTLKVFSNPNTGLAMTSGSVKIISLKKTY